MKKLKEIIIFTLINNLISLSIGLVIFFLFIDKYTMCTWLSLVLISIITVII
jgi:hypothetical protein